MSKQYVKHERPDGAIGRGIQLRLTDAQWVALSQAGAERFIMSPNPRRDYLESIVDELTMDRAKELEAVIAEAEAAPDSDEDAI